MQQPLRSASKSKINGKPPSQYAMSKVWKHLYQECEQLQQDPTKLMGRDFDIFEGLGVPSVSASIERYRSCKKNSDMVEFLFASDEDTDDMCLEMLKNQMVAMRLRLESDGGGAAEFLCVDGKKGKFCDPSEKQIQVMEGTVATSDLIESLFGVLDTIVNTQSKNLSFHSASSIATWQFNKTEAWILSLTPKQQLLLIDQCRRNGRRLKVCMLC